MNCWKNENNRENMLYSMFCAAEAVLWGQRTGAVGNKWIVRRWPWLAPSSPCRANHVGCVIATGLSPRPTIPRPSGAPLPRRIPSQAFGVSLPRYHPLIRNTNTRPFRVSDRHHHRHKGSGRWCITKRMDARSVRPQLQTAILKLRRSVKTGRVDKK